MGEQCALSDFDLGIVGGARWAGLRISKTANLLGDFDTKCLWRLERMVQITKKKKNIQCVALLWVATPCHDTSHMEL